MIDDTSIKSNFVGRDGFRWFIAQVAPTKNQQKQRDSGWGNRFKIRIMGYHPYDDSVKDDDLPYAHVMMPPTSGSGGANTSETVMLRQGDVVFGFFLDGDDAQLPVILGCFGRTPEVPNPKPQGKPTQEFKPFTGYTQKIKGTSKMGKEESNDNQGIVNIPPIRNPKNALGGLLDGLLGGNMGQALSAISGALNSALGAIGQGSAEVAGVAGAVASVISNASSVIPGSSSAGQVATSAAQAIASAAGQDAAALTSSIQAFAEAASSASSNFTQGSTSIPPGTATIEERRQKAGTPLTDSLANSMKIPPGGRGNIVLRVHTSINNTIIKLHTTTSVYDLNKEIKITSERIAKFFKPMVEVAILEVDKEVWGRTPAGLEKQYQIYYTRTYAAVLAATQDANAAQTQGDKAGLNRQLEFEPPSLAYQEAHAQIQEQAERELERAMYDHVARVFRFIAESPGDVPICVAENVVVRAAVELGYILHELITPYLVPLEPIDGLINVKQDVWTTREIFEELNKAPGAPSFGYNIGSGQFPIPKVDIPRMIRVTPIAAGSARNKQVLFQNETRNAVNISYADGISGFNGKCYTGPPPCVGLVIEIVGGEPDEDARVKPIFGRFPTEEEVGPYASKIRSVGLIGIKIIRPGKGYKYTPKIRISDTANQGFGAIAYAKVDWDRTSPTYGQIVKIVVTDPGESYPKNICPVEGTNNIDPDEAGKANIGGYLNSIDVANPGRGYKKGDKFADAVVASFATPIISLGRVVGVQINKPKLFDELPDLSIDSETGDGALMNAILDDIEPPDLQKGYIRIIDCVGYFSDREKRIPIGYVGGRPYFGAYHVLSNGIRMTGSPNNEFARIIYTTPDASVVDVLEIPEGVTALDTTFT